MDSSRARIRLRAERQRVLRRLEGLARDIAAIMDQMQLDPPDDEHDPDGATIAFERAMSQSLEVQARQRLVEIDAALRRVDEGVYGICPDCGRPVSDERLDARPTARRCTACVTG